MGHHRWLCYLASSDLFRPYGPTSTWVDQGATRFFNLLFCMLEALETNRFNLHFHPVLHPWAFACRGLFNDYLKYLDDHSCVPFCFPQILEFIICAICRGALVSDLPGCLEHPRCLRKCVLYPSLYSYLLWRGRMDDLVHVPVVCQLSSVFWCLRSFRFVCQFIGTVACMIFPSYLKLEGTVFCQHDMQYAKFFLWPWFLSQFCMQNNKC